jgi:hypothetical protein
MIKAKSLKRKFSINKLLILFVFLASCKAMKPIDKYSGLWLGELKNENIADHQMIEVRGEKIYFYDSNKVVDSTYTIKRNKIINDSKSILGKVKLLDESKILQIKNSIEENHNTESLKKVTPTQLSCRRELLDKIGEEDVEWHVVITEKGEYYCTNKIQDVEDLSKYEFSKINILKIGNTFFLVNQNRRGKNILAPIINIRDDEFEVYNDFEKDNFKIIWGIP